MVQNLDWTIELEHVGDTGWLLVILRFVKFENNVKFDSGSLSDPSRRGHVFVSKSKLLT